MEAEVVTSQQNSELLSEYADKLRSLCELWLEHYRRRQMALGLLPLLFGLTLTSFLFGPTVLKTIPSVLSGDSQLEISNAVTLFFGGSLIIILCAAIALSWMIVKYFKSATISMVLLEKDIETISQRLEILIRAYSQFTEHGGKDRHRLSALDIRLTDAEGALLYARKVRYPSQSLAGFFYDIKRIQADTKRNRDAYYKHQFDSNDDNDDDL